MGSRRTRPTSKNIDIPMIKEAAMIAPRMCLAPNNSVKRSAICLAPPLKERTRPSMAPRPKIKVMWPKVDPIPFSKIEGTFSKGIPKPMAAIVETTMREIKVLSLTTDMRMMRRIMAKPVTIRGKEGPFSR